MCNKGSTNQQELMAWQMTAEEEVLPLMVTGVNKVFVCFTIKFVSVDVFEIIIDSIQEEEGLQSSKEAGVNIVFIHSNY